jgi:hypothetical protein
MNQEQLFYESDLDALRDDVAACGGSKVVGQWFWPDKMLETARNAVNDRLNSEKRDRFTEGQVRLIVRKAKEARGFSAWLNYTCDETGFERPKPRNPKEEAISLMERAEALARESRKVADALERLSRAPLAVVTSKQQSA